MRAAGVVVGVATAWVVAMLLGDAAVQTPAPGPALRSRSVRAVAGPSVPRPSVPASRFDAVVSDASSDAPSAPVAATAGLPFGISGAQVGLPEPVDPPSLDAADTDEPPDVWPPEEPE